MLVASSWLVTILNYLCYVNEIYFIPFVVNEVSSNSINSHFSWENLTFCFYLENEKRETSIPGKCEKLFKKSIVEIPFLK